MNKTAFLFSGQGSQYPAMGKDLAEKYSSAERILECGSDILHFDLKKTIFEGTAEELSKTLVSQPSILAVSLMAFEAAREEGFEFTAVAGHSLGEYAAMRASEMLDNERAFTAIKYRSEAMDRAAAKNPGCMAAVLGLKAEDIEAVCDGIRNGGKYVVPVNYNSPAQTVIAGTAEAMADAEAILKEKGAKRVVRLAVSAAFHSALMNEAAEEFKEKAKTITFNEPKCDFYANVYGGKLTDFSNMPSYLSTHICSPVKFVSELNAMKNDGIENFIELGPNKVLTGLVKKTLEGVNALNIENIPTLGKAKELLQ